MKTASPVLVFVTFVLLCVALSPPALAQRLTDFGTRQSADLAPEKFTDTEITRLLGLLAERLKTPDAAEPATASAILVGFTRRLQNAQFSRPQEELIRTRLNEIGRSHASLRNDVADAIRTLNAFTVGRTAPEIVGKDLDGQPIRLSDYRGKVVLLTFSGEWCGICRSEYPYHRLLLDLYKAWPFAIVSVESGRDPAAMKKTKTDQGLSYRSFWDEADPKSEGKIASAWQVTGWPTVYVLDSAGVIRFVDVRKEDLLKAVRQLLTAQVEAQSNLKGTGRSPEQPVP